MLPSLAGFALLGWLSTRAGSTPAWGCRTLMIEGLRRLGAQRRWRCCCSPAGRAWFSCSSPLMAQWSRRHEFQADAYAMAQADGGARVGPAQALPGQRLHAHARPAVREVLLLAPLATSAWRACPPPRRMTTMFPKKTGHADQERRADSYRNCKPGTASGWQLHAGAMRKPPLRQLPRDHGLRECRGLHRPRAGTTMDLFVNGRCVVRLKHARWAGHLGHRFRLRRASTPAGRAMSAQRRAWWWPATGATAWSKRPTANAASATRAARKPGRGGRPGALVAPPGQGDEGTIEKVLPRRNLFYRQDEIRTKSFGGQPRPGADPDRRRAGVFGEPARTRPDRRRGRRHHAVDRAKQSDLAEPFARAPGSGCCPTAIWSVQAAGPGSHHYNALPLSLAQPAKHRAALLQHW